MTDTDSFILEIQTEDLFKDMLENHELFDFSGYSSEHSMFQGLSSAVIKNLREKNKKVLGKIKDESLHSQTRKNGVCRRTWNYIEKAHTTD